VLIHIAEPSPFFDPWDYKNERWEELNEFPQRARPPSKYPSFETLMAERNHLSPSTLGRTLLPRISRFTAMT